MSNNNNSKYLDVEQVATMFGLSKKTIYHMHSTGYLPSIKLGSRVLFDKEELRERIKEIKEETRSKNKKKNSET